jgi:pimeloyl-ACP methyl ester carboxylesterase
MTARRRWILGVTAAALVAIFALAVWFVRHPLRAMELMGRVGLRAAGMRPAERPGPRGPIFYYAGGEGPPVVLIHGANDQAGAWARIVKPLLAGHRVVALDLPGHGNSAPEHGPLSAQDVFDGVDAFVAAEAAQGPVTLVGNSLGGWMALRVAQARPRDVAHVILVNGAAVTGDDHGISLLPRTRAEAARGLSALTGPRTPLAPAFVLDDLVRRAPASPLARIMAAPLGPTLDGRLGEIEVPVTLLWGEADRLLDLPYARRVAAGLPRARLVTFPGCGHIPQRECPDQLVTALQQALAQPPTGPAVLATP